MAGFYIDGHPIPTPSQWDPTITNVVTSYSGQTTLDGKQHNSVIRTRISYNVAFGTLKADEASLLDWLIDGKNTVTVTYPANTDTGAEQKTFIVGDRQRTLLRIHNGLEYWTGYAFTLTEV